MYVEVCLYGGRLIMCCTEESNKIVMFVGHNKHNIFLKIYSIGNKKK